MRPYQLSRVATTLNDSGTLDYASVTDLANMTTWRQATGDAGAGTLENSATPVLVALDGTDASGNAAASPAEGGRLVSGGQLG